MKLYIDVPNSFSVTHYHNHAEIRSGYQAIISAAIGLNIPIELFKAVPFLGSEERPDLEDGVYYAFHAQNPGTNSYCVKPSALPGLWYFDAGGYSGWCELANSPDLQEQGGAYDPDEAEKIIAHYRRKFSEENFSVLKQSDDELEPEIAALDDFIFYPLQVNSDEVLKLGRFVQFEVIRRLAELSTQYGRHVVLKRHPLCDSAAVDKVLEELEGHPFVHMSRSSVHRLIPASRCVLVSNSGVGLQALIHGKPVFTLALSEYSHMTAGIETLDDLDGVFHVTSAGQASKTKRQLGYLLNEYWVDISSEDAIAERLRAHVSDFETRAKKTAAPKETDAKPVLSILHRANKELSDVVELILMTYKHLDDVQKEKVSAVLVRTVNAGQKVEQILRQTDGHVWRKCIGIIRQRDPARAAALARDILKESPQDSWAMLTLSKILFDLRKNGEAMEMARQAADCDGASAEAMIFLGRKLLQKEIRDVDQALAYARKTLVSSPDYAHAYWLEARALSFQTKYDEALTSVSKAIALMPDDAGFLKLRDYLQAQLDADTVTPEEAPAG